MPASTDDLRAGTEVVEVPVAVEDDPTNPLAVHLERLVCVAGVDMGRTFTVGTTPSIVGRGGDIDLKSSEISRRHARLWRDNRGVVSLEDLGSTNGTLVNATTVQGAVELQLGDRIQFGSTIFVFSRQDELEERLQQMNKLDAMGSLVKGLAHDFNNILQVLQVGLEELEDRWPERDEAARQTLDEMTRATTSAAGLVRRLLRLGRGKPQTSELNTLESIVDETIEMARRLKLDDIRMTTQIAPDALVCGSREELKQVFLNLVINARDAMPRGGQISIQASVRALDRATALSLHLETEGPYIDVTVSDTGEGMAPETLARIFEPFFTTKPVGKGSGLGLAMVYSSVRNHRGAIYAESVLGRGTTFRVLLPLASR